jgi:DNA-binding transcriptional regulator GbsR (MarR family)
LPIVQDERPALNRPVQVDANLENWRTQIRNAGVEAEELFLEAIQEIFTTEQEREISITKNMVLELNNTVQGEIASLENTIIYLAKKGRASEQDDPRIKEFNKKVVESGKKIRNHAVEIRSQPTKINLTFVEPI